MKKSASVILIASSVILMACQLQYLVSGQSSSATEIPAKAKATATINPGSTYPGPNEPPPRVPVPSGATILTANENLTIRSTASVVAPSVGSMNKGDVAQIAARTAANDWFQVLVFSGLIPVQGWVPANQVTVEGPLDKLPVIQPAPLPPPASSSASSKIVVPPTPTRAVYPSSSQPNVPTPVRKTYP